MWWWQSVAFGGAFSLGASVPADHFTLWAAAGRARNATSPAAPRESVVSTSRRFQWVGIALSSRDHVGVVSAGRLARALTLRGSEASVVAPKRRARRAGRSTQVRSGNRGGRH